MKTTSTILVVFTIVNMTFQPVFGQRYLVHIDTTQYFQHSATLTTFDAMEQDVVEYPISYIHDSDYEVDFKSMKLKCKYYDNSTAEFKIVKVMNKTKDFEFEIVEGNDRITRVFVDPALDPSEGLVMIVRWNEMVDGVPMTKGWFSRNIGFKTLSESHQ